MEKSSLYKVAEPLQAPVKGLRTSTLHQGKLQSAVNSSLSHCVSSEDAATSFLDRSHSLQPGARLHPSSSFPTGDHTHSLSISDIEEDSFNTPGTEQRAPAHIISNQLSADVLLVDANTTADVRKSSHSVALPVTSVRVPSPVKVVSHVRAPDRDAQSRRFSSNFVDMPPPASSAAYQEPPTAPVRDVPKEETTVSAVKKEKRKGHVVSSRYMSGSSKATSNRPPHVSRTSSVAQRSLSSASKTRPPTQIGERRQACKHPDGTVRTTESSRSMEGVFKVPSHPHARKTVSRTPQLPPNTARQQDRAERFFQTPIQGQGIAMSTPVQRDGDAAATHDGSFMANFGKPPSAIKSGKIKGRGQHPTEATKTTDKGREVDELEMELLYNRLIQFTYMDIMSYKALKNQEKEAKSQIHGLWQAVEDKKEEVAQLTRQVGEEERKLAVDKALDTQLSGLGPVCSQLAVLEREHKVLAQALDATRHDMVLDGVVPVTEEHMEVELAETEALLGDINMLLQKRIPNVLDFSSSSAGIVEMLEKEYDELERCSEQLAKLIRTQVKNTSLHFEKVLH